MPGVLGTMNDLRRNWVFHYIDSNGRFSAFNLLMKFRPEWDEDSFG